MYSGQFVYAGSKATLSVGNILPVSSMPEGTIISNVEAKQGDRGTLARTSGTSAIIIGHSEDGKKTRIRLPSGIRKSIQSTCRGMVGICLEVQELISHFLRPTEPTSRPTPRRETGQELEVLL
jgi:large subunit ribosomal protein L8e